MSDCRHSGKPEPKESMMPDFTYLVTVTAQTQEQADTVMQERILFDEDYGFDYRIDYEWK